MAASQIGDPIRRYSRKGIGSTKRRSKTQKNVQAQDTSEPRDSRTRVMGSAWTDASLQEGRVFGMGMY
eukprot:9469577-Pyramimonas_sp.AAC.1